MAIPVMAPMVMAIMVITIGAITIMIITMARESGLRRTGRIMFMIGPILPATADTPLDG
jgi:hypothetical protein